MTSPGFYGQCVVGSGGDDAPADDDVPGFNPFADVSYYINPENQNEIYSSVATLSPGDPTRSTLEAVANVPSAYWIDTKDKITLTVNNATDTVEEILADAAGRHPVPLVVFIVYDAPNRDCAAKASNGELCCTYNADGTCDYTAGGDCSAGLQEYEDEYITPFAQVLAQFNGIVPVVLVIEPDSLPNLATNLGIPACGDAATQAAYKGAIPIAVNALSAACPDSCTLYADAAHGGWLGWPTNLAAYVDLIDELGIAPKIRGFTTNSANYQPLGTSCAGASCAAFRALPANYTAVVPRGVWPEVSPLGLAPSSDSSEAGVAAADCCADPCGLLGQGNPANNEMNYAYQLVHAAKATISGFNPTAIIDTVLRYRAPPLSLQVLQHTRPDVNAAYRLAASLFFSPKGRNGVSDMRSDCANWCNIRGAGIGVKPTTATDSDGLVDAYFWLKTPGESDGCTAELPTGGACPRYDSSCASADSIGTQSGEPDAPEAGDWFDFEIKQLAANCVWASAV